MAHTQKFLLAFQKISLSKSDMWFRTAKREYAISPMAHKKMFSPNCITISISIQFYTVQFHFPEPLFLLFLKIQKPHCLSFQIMRTVVPVSYTHLRAHETDSYLVCRLL